MASTQQRLNTAAEAEDINGLYKCIREDPQILGHIDNIPFVDTPLHTAASAGRTNFALEMMNLKPSFGRKLNPDGLSPLHLALQNRHFETVRQLISFDKELIRVKGRESITPLHYVAQEYERHLLAEFLCACPAAIEDRTIRGETALHIAVKRLNSEASKVLLGWMRRTHRRKILNWMDNEGNTVLHIAAFTSQPQACYLSILRNAENFKGFTALDLARRFDSEEIHDIFLSTKVSRGSSLANDIYSLADFLQSGDGFFEVICGWIFRVRSGLSLENPFLSLVLLLVGVLEVICGWIVRAGQRLQLAVSKCPVLLYVPLVIAVFGIIIMDVFIRDPTITSSMATFQTSLSPPSGVVDIDNNHNLPTDNATTMSTTTDTFQTGLNPLGPGRVVDHNHNPPTSNMTAAYNTSNGVAIRQSMLLIAMIIIVISSPWGPMLGVFIICLMISCRLLFAYISPSLSPSNIFDYLPFCALLAFVSSFLFSRFWNDTIYCFLSDHKKKHFQMLQRLFDELN
ncbi:Ankyrin repeat-containing protein BDA1 [Camellia lanceoleosa]|uniref:Ankyrin repeat-containing protein BDA1 n=1 Tax=Camellia lanceoleosa TaxID=1840588 RepID=A0ACC0FIP3_9ERIC|nr:Ankyrin repeat-containing protein BDA1 [Camellia lanceoleosa]